ncbi:diguanylate cyclase [Bacillus sp. BRMEA1]|uniref:diguanylate cyclase n=1 Tax=Neobacillus endophyticus TaxID=2738405 RepID=UPI0015651EC5|nr:diguanylate cyclase [Neobacillus endophyticus]NRD80946.1 diguanylate cyclase [Neobacillus endophyticus]
MAVLKITQDIIANFSIVTAYLFLCSQVIFRNRNINSPASFSMKLKFGFVSGVHGIVLMLFTVPISGTILDFRQLAVIIAALYGGDISSVVAAFMLFFMRLFAFGVVNTSSFIAALNTLVISGVVGVVCSKESLTFWRKWIYSILVCDIFTGAVFIINMGTSGITPMIIYITMLSIGGMFTAYLTDFLIKVKIQFQRYEQEATIDYLTGLYNHRSFDERYNVLLQTAVEKEEFLSIALVDIDFFKKVNDTYGHVNGDAILKQLGELLKSSSRSFDTISRNGGEEFSVLLYDTPHEHALIIAERIRAAIANHSFFLNDSSTINLTVSIGVATYPDTSKDDLLEKADEALYKAKANGRNQVCTNRTEDIRSLLNLQT